MRAVSVNAENSIDRAMDGVLKQTKLFPQPRKHFVKPYSR